MGQVQEQSEGHGCSRRLFSAVEVACHTIAPQFFSAGGKSEGVAGLSVCLSLLPPSPPSVLSCTFTSLSFFCFVFAILELLEGSRPSRQQLQF